MRRVRPWVIVSGCVLAIAVAAAAVIWRQGDFWRASAANYLRERLSSEFGAEFQATDVRVRWAPPGLSLGRVTFHRPGEPWVLAADDIRISFNLYATLFGRERLGRVVVERPRLFVRRAAPAGAGGSAAPPRSVLAGTAPLAERARSLLRPPFFLRVLEISDGRVEVLEADGTLTSADGVELALLLSSGGARLTVEVAELARDGGGRRIELGGVDADLALEETGIGVRRLIAAGGPVGARLQGTVGYDGAISLKGELSAGIDRLAALAGRPGLAGGRARFEGSLAGRWPDPEATGTLALGALVLGGRRWPDARATVGWSARRLTVADLRVAVGEGTLLFSGSADLPRGGTPRYVIEARARGVDPSRLPGIPDGVLSRVRGLDGTVRWKGSGTGAAAVGAGSLDATLVLATAGQDRLALQARAALSGGALVIEEGRAAGLSVEAAGSGAWRPGEGFSARVSGVAGDLGLLVPAAAGAVGGRGSFEGDVAFGPAGWSYRGTVRLAQASVGKVRGVEARARVEIGEGRARLVESVVAWPGARGGVTGTIDLASGSLEAAAVLDEISVAETARLFGSGAEGAEGSASARLRIRGTLQEPEISGDIAAGPLRFRSAAADSAQLTFSYAGRRLGIDKLRLRRGSSELKLAGELRGGRDLSAEFESAAFDLRDFVSGSSLELAGTLRGRVRGPLDALVLEGGVKAARLRYGGFDLRGGELAVDLRGGKAAVTGWIASPENKLRAVFEPLAGWRFDADLELRQFAPEIVHSGAGGFPPALARIVGQASFLAAGSLRARGRLLEPASVRADLRLETLWLQAGGRTLQNRAPVLVAWREGGLVVEDFRLLGDQYHLELQGSGGPAAGWDLRVSGAVNLALLKGYWRELQEVEGAGDLRLTITGPWAAPVPEGSLTVHDAFLKARSLPEPLEHLEGRLELREGTLTAPSLSGSIGDGSFRGSGSYRMAADEIAAEVEGRLDLSLFRSRLPGTRELRGPLDVRLRLAGPIAAPAFSGDVEVVDAELFARPFPAKITGLHGRVRLATDRLEIAQLAGQTGGGSIGLTGSVAWDPAPGRIDLDLVADGILVSLADGLKAQGDLRLGLHGGPSDLRLAGEVRILKARYLREFGEKAPRIVPAVVDGQAGGGAVPELDRTAVDVKVRATDNVWIANKTAKIEASVALDVGGTLGAPLVRGEISGIQGEAYYLSRKFRLESGTLRFVPPAVVPLLDLQASTTVGETQILFLMDGPLDKLSYHLASLPAMSQEDLISLLTIGETRATLARRGDRAGLAGAAVFTTEPLVNALGDEARTSMGLEVLQLEPVVGEGSQASARLTLGTHLSDRLFVSYSRNLGAAEDQQVAVQYYLLDYLSVWGQEMRQGIYSLDVVFRYAFP